MNLSEKIYSCRKQAGMSQEDLAARLNVSRQAVSKWETGEAEPEIRKLQQLSQIFGVSIDWLLSTEAQPEPADSSLPDWVNHLPKNLGRFVRRYGWLVGVYVSVGGALIIALGCFVRYSVKNMFGNMFHPSLVDPSFTATVNPILENSPVYMMANVFIVIGCISVLAGIILAIILKRFGKNR